MTTPEILLKAANVIEARGWHQGSYIPNMADKATCPVCVLAAINVARGLPPDCMYDPYAPGPAYEAAFEFAGWLGLLNVPEVVDTVGEGWNDAPGRTADEVTSALRECAAELRSGS